jgi:hypothetical protein
MNLGNAVEVWRKGGNGGTVNKAAWTLWKAHDSLQLTPYYYRTFTAIFIKLHYSYLVHIPVGIIDSSLLQNVQTGFLAHPASSSMGVRFI